MDERTAGPGAHLPRAHLRLPDERARLRAHGRAARGRPATCAARRRRDDADVVVFNTCAVRENADNRLYGNLGHLRAGQGRAPRHADRRRRLPGAEGPRRDRPTRRRGSTSSSARTTSARCRCCSSGPGTTPRPRWRSLESLEVFPSTLPARRESAVRRLGVDLGRAATTPARSASSRRCAARRRTAAPARSSPRSQALVDQGVLEVTLLGQNVNSYGVEFGDRRAFGKLLRALRRRSTGLERVRFTSPHPRDFTDDVIAAMAETPTVCHQLHMPLQSGSDAVLRAMRRSLPAGALPGHHRQGPRRDAGRGDHHRHHRRLPRRDRGRLRSRPCDVVRQARFAGAFTFQYSKRPGTPAAEMAGQLPKEVVQERYERLVALQDEISWAENRAQVGRRVEVLVAAGEGRKDAATGRLSGRARDGRLVHFARAPDGVRPGRRRRDRRHLRRAAPPHRRRRRCCRTAAPGPATPSEAGIRPSTPGHPARACRRSASPRRCRRPPAAAALDSSGQLEEQPRQFRRAGSAGPGGCRGDLGVPPRRVTSGRAQAAAASNAGVRRRRRGRAPVARM